VSDHTPEGFTPLDEVKEKISGQLLQQAQEALQNQIINDLKAKAQVALLVE
jgi:hypothetical protein